MSWYFARPGYFIIPSAERSRCMVAATGKGLPILSAHRETASLTCISLQPKCSRKTYIHRHQVVLHKVYECTKFCFQLLWLSLVAWLETVLPAFKNVTSNTKTHDQKKLAAFFSQQQPIDSLCMEKQEAVTAAVTCDVITFQKNRIFPDLLTGTVAILLVPIFP